jgi:hypothetical protein
MTAATKTKESRSKTGSAAVETRKAAPAKATPAPRGSTAAHADAGEAKEAREAARLQPARVKQPPRASGGHCTRADDDAAGRINKRISRDHEQQQTSD